jgi:hypothetical protein
MFSARRTIRAFARGQIVDDHHCLAKLAVAVDRDVCVKRAAAKCTARGVGIERERERS